MFAVVFIVISGLLADVALSPRTEGRTVDLLRTSYATITSGSYQWVIAAWLTSIYLWLCTLAPKLRILEFGLFTAVLGTYIIRYSDSSQSTHAVTFLAGLTTCSIARAVYRGLGPRGRIAINLGIPVLLAFFALVFTGEANREYVYYGVKRFSGIWNNPNNCGLLMAMATTMLFGGLFLSLEAFNKHSRIYIRIVIIVAACATLYGLVKSLSRGAWVSVVVGILYTYCSVQWSDARQRAKLERIAAVLVVLCCTAAMIVFVLKSVDMPVLRRVGSIFNPYDFSALNRISAYRDALGLIATKPIFGYGWNAALDSITLLSSPNLQSAEAINTNTYLKLALSIGLLPLGISLALICESILPSAKTVSRSDDTILTTLCRGVVVVAAIGFWFNGGLLTAALWPIFWMASGFVSAPSSELTTIEGQLIKRWRIKVASAFAVIVVVGIGLAAHDLSNGVNLRQIEIPKQLGVRCAGIMPRGSARFPLVIIIRPATQIAFQRRELQALSSQGFAAVEIASGPLALSQFNTVHKYLHQQPWCDHCAAWIEFGNEPQVCAGEQLGSEEPLLAAFVKGCESTSTSMQAAAVEASADATSSRSCSVAVYFNSDPNHRATHFPTTPDFVCNTLANENDVPAVVKLLGEFTARRLGPIGPALQTHGGNWAMAFMLVLVIAVGVATFRSLRNSGWFGLQARTLWYLAAGSLFVATLLSCGPKVAGHMRVTEATATLARLAPHQCPVRDIDFMLEIAKGHRMTITEVRTHAELASYTRTKLVNWFVNDDIYFNFVLSPIISGKTLDYRLRTELWNYFYLLTRKKYSPKEAAAVVIRFLRERISISNGIPTDSLQTAWLNRITNTEDFNSLSVAALRSVGIPARIQREGYVEIWENGEWQRATKPVSLDCLP